MSVPIFACAACDQTTVGFSCGTCLDGGRRKIEGGVINFPGTTFDSDIVGPVLLSRGRAFLTQEAADVLRRSGYPMSDYDITIVVPEDPRVPRSRTWRTRSQAHRAPMSSLWKRWWDKIKPNM